MFLDKIENLEKIEILECENLVDHFEKI